MKVTVLNGSPRREGNTAALSSAVMSALAKRGAEVEEVRLFAKNILGCNNCGGCQTGSQATLCSIPDDMGCLFPKFTGAGAVVFATPIYMWNFTPCTLAFMNRMHCLCRHGTDFNLMRGKRVALALTMGDEESVASSAIAAFREFCDYFGMTYAGCVSVPFADRSKILAGSNSAEIGALADRILAQS